MELFDKKLYVDAAKEFEKASKIDSLEYTYFENAASAYYMGGNIAKALTFSEKVIDQFQPKTGKSEYINALTQLRIGGKEKACELLQQAMDYGFSKARTTYEQNCK